MRVPFLNASLPGLLLLLACSDQPNPVDPQFALGSGQTVRLVDQCDEESFDAALDDEDACTRSAGGGITFDNFIHQLEQHGSVGAWRITPSMLTVHEGAVVTVSNVGGEDHTYTEVEEFGGGIVDILNQLSGNTVVAPECANAEIIEEGTSTTETFDEEGVEKYQCCIHPWMRQVVRVK